MNNRRKRQKRQAGLGILAFFSIFLSFFAVSVLADEPSELVLFEKALNLSRQGECRQALPIWRQLLKKQPEQLSVANNLAACLLEQGLFHQAQKVLDGAVKADPSRAALWQNLQKVYANLAKQAYAPVLGHHEKFNLQGVFVDRQVKKVTLPASPRIKPSAQTACPQPSTAALPPASTSSASIHIPQIPKLVMALMASKKAWESRKVGQYLSFYSPHFQPEKGESLAHWQQKRRQRLQQPKWIRVQLTEVKLAPVSEDLVWVHAKQDYRSNLFHSVSHKAWLWQKVKGRWQIVRELNLEEKRA